MGVGRGQAGLLVFVALLFALVAFAMLARKIRLPYPIVLVLAGLAVSLVPGLPHVTLDPDAVFFVVLPPLLYAAAWNTSWRDFSYNLVSISSLAIGLVAFTVTGVALAAPYILPAFDWTTGFLLGAVVSPTDAVAATDVLEGESLVNDATGLLALELGISILASGMAPSAVHVVLRFGQLVAGGLTVGLLIGVLAQWVENRIDDGPIEIAISIFVPYAAYLVAEGVHASGVLAVVAAGVWLSRKSSQFFSPNVRIQVYSVWNALTFVLNGLVFLLIGLQLPYVLAAIRESDLKTLVLSGAAFSALVIALRLAWVFPGARISYFIRSRLLHQRETTPPPRVLIVTGWAGMRGVVALAAAMALPDRMPGGAPFPQRNLIVFLTFCVILATLVVQGLTLPPLIRLLGVGGSTGPACEEREARRLAIEAGLAHLQTSRPADRPDLHPIYDDLAHHYRQRLADVVSDGDDADRGKRADPEQHRRLRDISRELARIERNTAIRLRDEGRINDDVLRQIERDLDLAEARLVETQS